MNKLFSIEEEGQRYFYETYLPRVDSSLSIEDVIEDNSDGILNGNLLEFKLGATDLNAHLAQMVKYQSSRRIKGKPLPANMILVSLNTQKAYVYKTEDYIESVEKVYHVSASINNMGFIGLPPSVEIDYSKQMGEHELIKVLKTNSFTKINIDEDCIVGWANSYYKLNKGARKSDFIGDLSGHTQIVGEIRKPTIFEDYIHPYLHDDNVRFQYLMDKLNDDLQKKNLGAFYTPLPYAKKSLELLREAIKRVPDGNEYIILDRCAGTGNLQQQLTDEELSRTILSTVEYYEYKVLNQVLGSKVLEIIPPSETVDTFNQGLVRGADALSKEYIESDIIRSYVDNPKCTIILFENPPYTEATSIEHQKAGAAKKSTGWKKTHVLTEMAKQGIPRNDLGNAFVWSGFEYYLRQPTDSYIVYLPIMYWKNHHIVNKRFMGGYAFNKRHFHTNTNAAISCIYWSNEDSDVSEIDLEAFNLDAKNKLVDEGVITAERIYTTFSKQYYDKRSFPNDDEKNSIVCNLNGTERDSGRLKSKYNENIVAYMVAASSGFDNARTHSNLLVAGQYNGNGFYVRKDNFMEKLPLFTASRYTDINNDWKIMSFTMKSGDGSEDYQKDVRDKKLDKYLLKTLLWVSLSHYPHMRTLTGSDGRFYRNELCLDTTNGETLASEKIKEMKLNKNEKILMEQWDRVFECALRCSEYDKTLTYGLYQIDEELNTSYKDEKGNNIRNYPELHGYINTLKALLKDYYIDEIQETLFHYKFVV